MIQTPIDLKREEEVAAYLEASWRKKLRRFNAGMPSEWFAFNNSVTSSFIYMRCVQKNSKDGSIVGVPLARWFRIHMLACSTNITGLVVVKFLDCVKYQYSYGLDPFKVKIPAHANPDDPAADHSPVICAPIDAMITVHGPADWAWNERLFAPPQAAAAGPTATISSGT